MSYFLLLNYAILSIKLQDVLYNINKSGKDEKMNQDVLRIAKKAFDEKLMAGTSGNISVFDRESGLMAITPSSYDYRIMQEKDIVVIDLDGNVEEGWLRPSSEWKMHAEIYRNVEHVNAVVHTHSPYATSFAVLQKEIPVILIEMLPFLNGSLEVSPYASQGSSQVGLNAVPILKRKNACLMANHGVVAVGKDVDQAYLASVYAEDVAKVYHMALTVGTPIEINRED